MDSTWAPWDAAQVEELRLIKAATLETHGLLRQLLAALPVAMTMTNGHAAQLPLDGRTNGHAPAAPSAPEVDVHGNPKVDCIRFEDRRSPAYTVRPTLPGGQRPYVAVPTGEYGVPDAYRYACIALQAYMAASDGEREKQLARLPKKLRMKVEISLMPAAAR